MIGETCTILPRVPNKAIRNGRRVDVIAVFPRHVRRPRLLLHAHHPSLSNVKPERPRTGTLPRIVYIARTEASHASPPQPIAVNRHLDDKHDDHDDLHKPRQGLMAIDLHRRPAAS